MGSWTYAVHKSFTATVSLMAFFIGYLLTRIAMVLPHACVSCYYVCSAENPKNILFNEIIPDRINLLKSGRDVIAPTPRVPVPRPRYRVEIRSPDNEVSMLTVHVTYVMRESDIEVVRVWTRSRDSEEGEIARRYVSQKNSVPYALLITLYREKEKGNEFMKKQELIDAAEASGLSRARTRSGKVGRNGASGKELYSGWTFMKTMLTKGLVVKSSCPAKYILSQEGLEAVNDCLLRSGLADHAVGKVPSQDLVSASDMEFACTSLADEEVSILSVDLRSQGKSVDVPAELFERGLVPNLVPCDDNAMPTTIPDNEEVQKTVFQMEGDSSSSLDALPGYKSVLVPI
ncbi:hypothetical protein GIB67_042398 [Kingdonia uniflora]|uniref:Crossover junction endonuclease MUS81 n=1 Tax=Kingdonia uniflora TaxID=39325 RepID=A0A7J7M862_9MAGN|nr:hypothetical protein GIB67_042398 [Kingdonia uniflora]